MQKMAVSWIHGRRGAVQRFYLLKPINHVQIFQELHPSCLNTDTSNNYCHYLITHVII